jgi:NitT/TauT family transport system substrate-binding protein
MRRGLPVQAAQGSGGMVEGSADLMGAKGGSGSGEVIGALLKAKGIDASKIQRIAAGGYTQGLTMLEQGAVSACVLIEPLSILRKDSYRTVVRAKEILPAMTTSVGITTREFAKSNPDKLKAIIAGRRMAVRRIYEDPVNAANIVAKAFNMDPKLAKEAVENMIGPQMWTEGGFDLTELNRIGEGLQLIGELQTMPEWTKIIDASFLPTDLQSIR